MEKKLDPEEKNLPEEEIDAVAGGTLFSDRISVGCSHPPITIIMPDGSMGSCPAPPQIIE
jgi:hypothetical protein